MVAILGANSVSGGYEIDNSLRFNDDDAASLKDTQSAGNRRTWTFSAWLKRSLGGGASQVIFNSGTNDGNYFVFNFVNDALSWHQYNGSAFEVLESTDAVYRDPSAWYHVVLRCDTTDSTADDRFQLYVNGVLQAHTANTTASENLDTDVNVNGHVFDIGNDDEFNQGYVPYDGYMAEVYLIDGTAKAPTDFGETDDNGVWIPKVYEGAYGTNGFYLEFKETGTGQNSSGIGADTSGNDHHCAVTNLAATDVTTDTPTNNFATLLPLRSGEGAAQQVFSEGNLQWTSTTRQSNATGASINFPPSGKWYVECYVKTAGAAGDDDFGIGIQGVAHDSMAKTNPATATYGDSAVYVTRRDSASRIEKNLANVIIGDTYSYTAGAIVQLAFDADSGKVYFGLNNAYWAEDGGTDGNPSSGTNHSTTLTSGVDYFYTLSQYSSTYVSVTNFGHDSSFAGNKSSGSANANDGEYGDFFYAPPTGFKCLCTKNLGEFG